MCKLWPSLSLQIAHEFIFSFSQTQMSQLCSQGDSTKDRVPAFQHTLGLTLTSFEEQPSQQLHVSTTFILEQRKTLEEMLFLSISQKTPLHSGPCLIKAL